MANVSRKIFLESSIFEAFIDRSNTKHQQSVEMLNRLAKDNYLLFTSLQVTEEVCGFLMAKVSKVVAFEFLQAILESNIELISSNRSDVSSVYKLMMEYKEKQVSFKEALSTVLMHKNNIPKIATFRFWNNLEGTSLSELSY